LLTVQCALCGRELAEEGCVVVEIHDFATWCTSLCPDCLLRLYTVINALLGVRHGKGSSSV